MAQVVSHQPLTLEAQVQFKTITHKTAGCGGNPSYVWGVVRK
jgi:hypothetical protein